MLSVGSRKDARKGLAFELGRGGGGVGMEENEVEEGEACSSEEDDAAIDPDVTLSYIDEKIRDILGHFQKDFEGGVSAENLGSKFGGYGSFLPTCPRSPSIWSHSRSPERAPNHYAPMSSCNRHAEGACHDPAVSISASVTLKNNSVLVSPQLNDTKKNEVRISAPIFGEGTLQNGVIPKPFQSNHQTILKVRIKVCPDNVLPRPNAAIYSDMGLDYSPSSSPEDSPSASGGFSLETHDVPSESPMSVFKIMTSFPVCGGCVLSPLPESLLHLMKNERLCLRDCKPGTSAIGVDTCNVFKNDAPPENNEKVLFGKKTHHVEKNMKFSEIKNLNCKADLRNEFDIEMPDGRMLVSDSLNTPKRSCSVDADEKAVTQPLEDAVKGSGISQEANKILSKDNAFSCDLSKEEPLESVPILDTRIVNNAGNDYLHLQEKLNFRSCSSDKVLEEGKMSNHKSVQFDPQNKGSGIAEKKCDAFNYATDGLKVRKDTIVNPAESINLKAPEKSILHEEEGERVLQARDYHSGMRRKSKGSEINGTPCVEHPKENTKVVSSVPLKEKNKSSHSNRSHLEDKRSALKCHKKSSRILNKESDSLGETKAELIEHGTDPMKTIFRDKAKDPRIGNEAEKAKDSLSVKEVETPPMPEADGKSSYVSSSMANGPMPDTAPAPLSHDVIEENWVCCDKCQKWRLLPYGTDPAHLPKKWICAMLSWLPGMKKCSISEEETTRALHALYQAPLLENQTTVNGPNSEVAPGAVFTSVQPLVQHHNPSLHLASGYGKKKNMRKDVPGHAMQLSNSIKNQHVSIRSRSSSEYQVESNASSKSSLQHSKKSTELRVEKFNGRQKKKHKMVERCSDGGGLVDQNDQSSKSKSQRGSNQDVLRTSKKLKTEGLHNANEAWHPDHNLTGNPMSVLTNHLQTKVTANSLFDHDDHSLFKDSKCNLMDSRGFKTKSKASIKVSSNGDCIEHFNTLYMEKYDKKDSSAKKRKTKEQQGCQVNLLAVAGSGFLVNDLANVKEEISESESKKEKKARISKSVGRQSLTIKMDGKIDKKGLVTRVLLSRSKEHPLGGMEKENKDMVEFEGKGQYRDFVESEPNLDCLVPKRDLSSVQTSTAANSNSSKVSGSCKTKSNFQEVQGSPVESVSSSPLRISSVGNGEKNTVGRDDIINVNFSVLGSPRRCSAREVINQVEQFETIRRDKSSSVVHHGSLEGYRDVDFDPTKGACDYVEKKAFLLSVGKAKDGMHLKPFRNMNDCPPFVLEENNIVAGSNTQVKNGGHDQEMQNNHCCSMSSKKSSSRPKEKRRSSNSDVEQCKFKKSDSFREKGDTCSAKNGNSFICDADMDSLNRSTYHENLRNERCNVVEKKDKKKRESVRNWSSEDGRDAKLNFGGNDNPEGNNLMAQQHRDIHSRVSETGTDSNKVSKSYAQDNPQKVMSHEGKMSPDPLILDQTEKLERASGRGKLKPLPHCGDKQLASIEDPCTVLSNTKGGRSEVSSVDVMTGDASKILKQPKMIDSQNETHHGSVRHMITNRVDALSPFRKDSNPSAASIVFKEARELKHISKRLKSEGREYESISLCFEAALKFLHGASLIESSSAESGKHGESTQSMAMYSDTAKLCEFCAHEYEKRKEMAAAALAYKCMEVAYMKVVFSKHYRASKDRQDLQTALHLAASGESPSSSASDIDNVNNLGTLDKTSSVKIVSSQVAGAHAIAARSRPLSVRLLDFVQYVNNAMEASRKSHNAFTGANVKSFESHSGPEGIASVRKVLDFSFHDVDGLLQLVRLSMDAIGR